LNGDVDEERAYRVAVIVIGHVMWLSTAALRIIGRTRTHRLRADVPWPIRLYPPLVWIPLVVATLFWKVESDLSSEVRVLGVAVALAGSLFGAWGMWSLGRSYGIGVDVFTAQRLRTDGPFALVRHPMYLGVLVYHVGASLVLAHPGLLALTAFVVVPYTAARVVYEERVLAEAFGQAFADYASRTPAVLPLPR
jgi:protein-S-isoprenylcysteine O-methyltransferase Ste14